MTERFYAGRFSFVKRIFSATSRGSISAMHLGIGSSPMTGHSHRLPSCPSPSSSFTTRDFQHPPDRQQGSEPTVWNS